MSSNKINKSLNIRPKVQCSSPCSYVVSQAACYDNESLPFSEGGTEESMVCQYAKHNFYMSFPVSQADLIQF